MTKSITIYGIKNCDTMKKARAWLDGKGLPTNFTTTRRPGSKRTAEGLERQVGWEALLNRAGTTFKKLPDGDKEGLSEKKAMALMLAQPSMIKRPVSISAANCWSDSSRRFTRRK